MNLKTEQKRSMYSPKISEDLIPRIYRAAKDANIPMTHWVNRAVERALPDTATPQEEPKPQNPAAPNGRDRVQHPNERAQIAQQ